MEKKQKKEVSAFAAVMDSLQYMMQSIQGRYRLETYLEMLGDWTDSQIRKGEEKGFAYIGGEVAVIADKGKEDVLIVIEMVFRDENQKRKLRSLEQYVEKRRFTRETIERLETALEMRFQIEKPEG